jgi:hypothetical protein
VAENAVFLGGDFAAPIERKVTEVEWETWANKVAEVTSVKRNFHEIFKMAADKCFRMDILEQKDGGQKLPIPNFVHIFEKCKTLFFDMQSELRKYIFEIQKNI